MPLKSRKNEVGAPSKEERMRAAILETAYEVFQRYGVRKTTLDDIAQAMGKRRSFLYYYFESKEELLRCVAENEISANVATIHEAVEKQTTVEGKMRTFFVAPLRLTLDRMKLFTKISEDLRAGDGQLLMMMRSLRASFDLREKALLARILREGIAKKAFRPMTDSAIESFVVFTLSAQRGIEMDLVLRDSTQDPLDSLEDMVDVFLRGLRP